MHCWSHMKKTYILLIVTVMFTVSGCDFFRKLAGRPTSDVIEVRKMEMLADIQQKEMREQEIRDSIAAVRKAEQDSVTARTFLAENKILVLAASRLGGIAKDDLQDGCGYRVILGSFKERSNANKLISKISGTEAAQPHFVTFRNGMIAVAVYPSDRIQDAALGLKRLKDSNVCPSDAWILKTK